jgi:hypothetical protein
MERDEMIAATTLQPSLNPLVNVKTQVIKISVINGKGIKYISPQASCNGSHY